MNEIEIICNWQLKILLIGSMHLIWKKLKQHLKLFTSFKAGSLHANVKAKEITMKLHYFTIVDVKIFFAFAFTYYTIQPLGRSNL